MTRRWGGISQFGTHCWAAELLKKHHRSSSIIPYFARVKLWLFDLFARLIGSRCSPILLEDHRALARQPTELVAAMDTPWFSKHPAETNKGSLRICTFFELAQLMFCSQTNTHKGERTLEWCSWRILIDSRESFLTCGSRTLLTPICRWTSTGTSCPTQSRSYRST